jgi:tRNA G18 (ribose-2'-O)-methylase SpoU
LETISIQKIKWIKSLHLKKNREKENLFLVEGEKIVNELIQNFPQLVRLIVCRNSGTFCFTLTKENIDDENKTFLAYGSRETDCLLYGIDIQSTFIFDYFNTVNQLSQSISELI